MANIQIDRELRLKLLRWLKQGSIDKLEYLAVCNDGKLTDEEWEEGMSDLTRVDGYSFCRRCQREGVCEMRDQAEGVSNYWENHRKEEERRKEIELTNKVLSERKRHGSDTDRQGY